jgi:hypothetical protein
VPSASSTVSPAAAPAIADASVEGVAAIVLPVPLHALTTASEAQ